MYKKTVIKAPVINSLCSIAGLHYTFRLQSLTATRPITLRIADIRTMPTWLLSISVLMGVTAFLVMQLVQGRHLI